MKKFLQLFLILFVALSLHAQLPTSLYDSWETYDDFTTDVTPWVTVDLQTTNTYGSNTYDFPGEGTPFAFMVWNPALTVPPAIPLHPAVTGDKYLIAIQSILFNDDKWLITPQLLGTPTTIFKFWAKSITAAYGLERFRVAVSMEGNDPEEFQVIHEPDYYEAPITWTEFVFDLSDYDGEEIYVAIQYASYDAFIFMLDDLRITAATGLGTQPEIKTRIYPNPASESLHLRFNSRINEIKIYNLAGRQVLNKAIGDHKAVVVVSGFNQGLYILQAITEKGVETHKIQVVR
ncbi:MAG: choice-of-anchor J domain-containing protein [Bacteroidales bacterium]|nr:choice-of-anchor J domain-containing protein [Bacteroidales bacterium]